MLQGSVQAKGPEQHSHIAQWWGHSVSPQAQLPPQVVGAACPTQALPAFLSALKKKTENSSEAVAAESNTGQPVPSSCSQCQPLLLQGELLQALRMGDQPTDC